MLLAIDIGNTHVTLGVFNGAALLASWRVASDRTKVVDEYAVIATGLFQLADLDRDDVDAAVMTSVVSTLTPVFEELCRRYFRVTPLRVEAGVKTGLRIHYEDPREVGPDRIVDAVAALKLHKPPLIVVDLGTATVFDAVSQEGDYLGGAIAPGIGLAADALAEKAAMLRRVDLRPPAHAVGTNTAAAMQSGIIFGYVGLVEEMIRRFKAEIGADAWVVGTGGWSTLISELTQSIDQVDEDLTLTGLRIVHELNEAPS